MPDKKGDRLKDAMSVVLAAAGIDEGNATADLKEYAGNDSPDFRGLVAKLTRQAGIAATKAYDALLEDQRILPHLTGSARKEKFKHPETFTDDELTDLGRYIQSARTSGRRASGDSPFFINSIPPSHGNARGGGSSS